MKFKVVSALLLLAALSASAQAPKKKRVAILNFDYGTVSSSVQAFFGTNVDIGQGIADLIVDRLVKDGTYSVIERKRLDAVLAEQNFSNSDRADATSAAKIGKVLGVDAIIVGSITKFGRDDRNIGVGGGGYGLGRFGVGSIGKKDAKAVVGITARMINIDTAEILASAQGNGESKRGGLSLGGGGGGWRGGGGGAVDLSRSNFGETILGEATYAACDQLAKELVESSGRIEAREVKIEGLVADVSGSEVIINIGKGMGLTVGTKLEVSRVTREVKDPATGKVLRKVTSPVGTLTITEVDEASAVGKFSGAGAAKVGDMVKTP